MKSLLISAFLASVVCHSSEARRSPTKPDFYYTPPSAPCRIVMMTAKVLNVNMNMKHIDLMKGEHLTPEFLRAQIRNGSSVGLLSKNDKAGAYPDQLGDPQGYFLSYLTYKVEIWTGASVGLLRKTDDQINPQHTIPVLVHDGMMISESRAIATYLANSRGAGEKIYPKDPKKRAMIDQMLYFDMGKLYQRFLELYPPMLIGGAPYDKDKADKLDEAVKMLEEYLTRNKWAAGNQMTLADISLLSSVSTLEAVGYDFSKYPKIMAWYDSSKKMIPDYQSVNQDGADIWKMLMDKYKQEHPM